VPSLDRPFALDVLDATATTDLETLTETLDEKLPMPKGAVHLLAGVANASEGAAAPSFYSVTRRVRDTGDNRCQFRRAI